MGRLAGAISKHQNQGTHEREIGRMPNEWRMLEPESIMVAGTRKGRTLTVISRRAPAPMFQTIERSLLVTMDGRGIIHVAANRAPSPKRLNQTHVRCAKVPPHIGAGSRHRRDGARVPVPLSAPLEAASKEIRGSNQ